MTKKKNPVEEKWNATLEEVRQIQKWFRVPNMAIVVTMKGFKSNSSTSRRVVFVFQLSHLQNFMTLNKGECIFFIKIQGKFNGVPFLGRLLFSKQQKIGLAPGWAWMSHILVVLRTMKWTEIHKLILKIYGHIMISCMWQNIL